MFRDFVSMSKCGPGNALSRKLSDVQGPGYDSIYKPTEKIPIPVGPTGFVFHEGRVGSTLVANLLACDREAMVFSESAPPSTVFMSMSRFPRSRQIEIFREILTIMCRSTYHKQCFFKFQSITSTMMSLALEG
jgi:hypothetical protein